MSNTFRSPALALAISLIASSQAHAQLAAASPTSSEEDQDHNEIHDDDHGHGETLETIIITAKRSGRAVNDEPLRVEVIGLEEIQEKAIMRPGNIATLVAETGGVRIQTTSPALGAANIRLQGMYGRYTQLLSDGLPLYGGQAASIGLLQIPPTDLSQVEVIKGSASSLYGGSALGGVINLVSRRPSEEAAGELLLNVTSRDGQDITGYTEMPLNDVIAVSFTGGAHRQTAQDLDSDGWIDMPSYERWTARPRLFWEGSSGSDLYATFGYMTEQRDGGTLKGATVPDGAAFPQTQDTSRYDGGLNANVPLTDQLNLNVRASAMVQLHDHRFGEVLEADQHESYLVETSLSGDAGRTNWVFGAAYQAENYVSDTFPAFDYTYETPGMFGVIDHDVNELLSLSLSGRLDHHNIYGAQFSPRASLLYKPGDWTIRASYGRGFFAPTPFVEEIEAAGLSRMSPLQGIREETAQTASLDMGFRSGGWEANASLFGSTVEGVTELEAFSSTPGGEADRVRLVNSEGDTTILGSEMLLRFQWNDIKLTGSYLYLDATEQDASGGRRELALTPRHSAGVVAMWERHGVGRLGFEAYYTGKQRLDGNPYRDESEPYFHLGLLAEYVTGPASWFINAENLLDVRQTREDPLLLLARSPEGQWTTNIWSRNDGMIINGGVRLTF